MNRIIFLLFFIFNFSPAHSGDILIIESKSKEKKETMVKITAQGHFLKISEENQDIIFNEKLKSIYVINHKETNFTHINQETFSKMGDMANNMLEMMKKKMATLPPEQRAMMEKMMKKNVPNFKNVIKPGPKTKYKEIAKEVKCQRWKCKKIEAIKGKEKRSELLVATAEDLNINESTYEIIISVHKFFSKLAGKTNLTSGQLFSIPELGGIPVFTKTFKNGEIKSTSTLKEVKKEKISSTFFEPPKNYHKKNIDIPTMPKHINIPKH